MNAERPDPANGSEPADPGIADPFEAEVRAALASAATGHTADPDLEQRARAMAARSARSSRVVLSAAAAAAVVVVLLVGSLAVRRGDDEQGLMTAPGTTSSTTSTALPSAPSTTAGTVVPPSTVTTPEIPSSTPDVEPPTAGAADVLRMRGIGTIDFGGSAADAERLITDLVGPPVGRYIEASCPERAIVSWGSFALWDQGGQLTEWWLIGDQSLGLRTDRGVGIGTGSEAVRDAYPEAAFGDSDLETPVRPAYAIADETGNTAWIAVLGGDGDVLAMRSTPGTLFPATCSGHGFTNATLTPGPHGLGPLLLGTPAPRAQAVLEALYGPPTESVDDDSGSCRSTTVGYRPGSATKLFLVGGRMVGYLEGPHDGQPRAVMSTTGAPVQTGMTVGELQATAGVAVLILTETTSQGPVTVVGQDGGEPVRVVVTADGQKATSVITRVGAAQVEPAC